MLADSFVTAHEAMAWGFKAGVEGVGVKVDFERHTILSVGLSLIRL